MIEKRIAHSGFLRLYRFLLLQHGMKAHNMRLAQVLKRTSNMLYGIPENTVFHEA